ncbi:MAG: FG-GAP-like repeat-containing protein [Phycisphaerales bacterium]
MTRTITTTSLLAACGVLAPLASAQNINFAPPSSYFVPDDGFGASPSYVAAGDIDGDGDIDLITDSNGPGADPTTVFWNDGSGSFSMGPQLLAGWGFGEVALGDIDSDGDLDVVRCSYFSNGVYFFRNNGDHTFEPAVFYSGGGGCIAVIFVDIDGDKDLDFVTVDKFGGKIRPYRNINGLGFTSVGLFNCGAQPYTLEAADIDLDGDMDMVVANEDDATLTVCLNDGTGAFPTTRTLNVGERPTGVAIADLDSNGQLDIVSADWGPLSPINNTISVILADSDGLPTPAVTVPVQGRPGSVAIDDVDGDGILDIVAACEADNSFAVLRGIGDGTFHPFVAFPASGSPGAIALADLDADGDPDLATVAGNNLVTASNTSGTPIEPPSFQIAWNTQYDNLFNEDIPTHIATDSVGNVIVGGSTYFTANENDIQIVKLDADGNELWSYVYNGDGDHYEVVYEMFIDADDNIIVTGESWGLNFSVQWVTIKLDPGGNAVWIRRYNGGNPQASQYPQDMAVSSTGNVAVGGWARDITFQTVHFSVVLYDAAGTTLFDKMIPGVTGVDGQANAVAFAPDGSVIATGSVDDDDEFGEEMLTAKIDPTGQILWAVRHDAANDVNFNETLGRVAYADSTGAYIAYSATGNPSSQTRVIKYDADGGVLWDTQIGGPGTPLKITPRNDGSVIVSASGGSGVVLAALSPSGSVLWTANTGGTYTSANPKGHMTLTPDGWIALIDQMGTDLGVLIYNSEGAFESETRIDSGSATDSAVAIAAASNGDLLALGSVQPSILHRRDYSVFRLTPSQTESCPADLAEPQGQLDFSDVTTFLVLFVGEDPAADFAEPIGQFDFSDVVAFLAAFAAGCP